MTQQTGIPAVTQRKRTNFDDETVVDIFLAKRRSRGRDAGTMSNHFADAHAISAKAVRDIWNMRTWKRVTKPHWDAADHQMALDRELCRACRLKGVTSLETACQTCQKKPKKHKDSDEGQGSDASGHDHHSDIPPESCNQEGAEGRDSAGAGGVGGIRT